MNNETVENQKPDHTKIWGKKCGNSYVPMIGNKPIEINGRYASCETRGDAIRAGKDARCWDFMSWE